MEVVEKRIMAPNLNWVSVIQGPPKKVRQLELQGARDLITLRNALPTLDTTCPPLEFTI